MKKPYFSRRAMMVVVDHLCRCGGKESDHQFDEMSCEPHGGGCPGAGCDRYRYAGELYEQARLDQGRLIDATFGRFVNRL